MPIPDILNDMFFKHIRVYKAISCWIVKEKQNVKIRPQLKPLLHFLLLFSLSDHHKTEVVFSAHLKKIPAFFAE